MPTPSPSTGLPAPIASVIQSLSASEADLAHEQLRTWFGRPWITANHALSLTSLLDPTTHRVLWSSITPESHRSRQSGNPAAGDIVVVEHAPGRHLVCELRLEADSLIFPFVQILHHDLELQSPDGPDRRRLLEIAPALIDLFENGQEHPTRVCIFAPGQPRVDSPGHHALTPYKRYLAIPLRLAASPAARSADSEGKSDRIRIIRPERIDFFDEYSQAYDHFWEQSPHLKDLVRKETPESLEQFRSGGGLRVIEIDGRWAGVLAAERENEYGLRGWMMRERVLSPEFRGSGMGAGVLQAFISDLASSPKTTMKHLEDQPDDDLALWGCIACRNEPSLKSARRLGRVDVGGTYWIDLP